MAAGQSHKPLLKRESRGSCEGALGAFPLGHCRALTSLHPPHLTPQPRQKKVSGQNTPEPRCQQARGSPHSEDWVLGRPGTEENPAAALSAPPTRHRSWQSRAALKPDASPHLRGSAPSPLSPKALFWDPLTWEARGAQQHHPTKHKTAPWSTALTSSGEQDRKGALGSHSFPECLPICRTALQILYTQLLSRQPCDIVTLLEITSVF